LNPIQEVAADGGEDADPGARSRYGPGMSHPRIRAAGPADAEALGRGVAEGVVDYREFAPPGWAPPAVADEIEHAREVVADLQSWCAVAELDGRVVGQVTIVPAARSGRPSAEPGLGHFSNLFVDRALWGSGLARELHAAALAAARERGFAELRLFAAAGQARARRFYEREGWVRTGEPAFDAAPGLVMAEYRRGLPA
jgi:GNAT superfamily N-acetyltransferase